MSFLMRAVVFWMVVIGAIALLRLFPASLAARVVFAQQGPLPERGERRSRYLLRWAAYWGSWVAQCALVFAGCWVVAMQFPALSEALWFLVLWVAVVPVLAAVAALAGLVALARSAKAAALGPDPVHAGFVESEETARVLERRRR
jgi:hypothetical protein